MTTRRNIEIEAISWEYSSKSSPANFLKSSYTVKLEPAYEML